MKLWIFQSWQYIVLFHFPCPLPYLSYDEFQASLLLFCVLVIILISKVILGRVPTCDSVYSGLYNPFLLGDQVARTMTRYPTQSHYPNTEPTIPSHIINNEHLSRNRQAYICKSLARTNPPITQNGGRMLYPFGHPVWSNFRLGRKTYQLSH